MKRILAIALLLMIYSGVSAQIDGDILFGQDQVITIDLQFESSDYYTQLVNFYNAGANEYLGANLTITDQAGVQEFISVGVRFKGNSSFGHPGTKKSFKIDFNEFVSGQNYDGLKKLNFSNCFKDPSMMREKVFFDVCQAAGVPAPRTSFANVIMNGEAIGFYAVVEQIDDQFLDWRIQDDAGNLFKAGDNFGGGPGGGGSAADLFYYGNDQTSYADRYELNTNEDVNDWTDLIELIDFINNSSELEFESEIENHIELTEYLRSAALDMLFSNLDSYTGSARNYYIYHNSTSNRWEWIKWDGNESFGSYTNNAGNMISLALNYHNNTRPLLDNIFNNSVLYNKYLNEVCDLTENFFNSSYINLRIDELKVLIAEHVYADGNKMYSNANFDTNIESDIIAGGPGPGGTTYGLKSFVQSRSSFLANQNDCNVFTGIDNSINSRATIFPNPSSSLVNISWGYTAEMSISIFDIVGKQVYFQATQNTQDLTLDLSEYPKGIYLIRLAESNGHVSQQKLILQ
ncbi:MAG: CotH kinase family protein [Bacteroidia bacterium]